MSPRPNVPPYWSEHGPGLSARAAVLVLAMSVALLIGLAAWLLVAVSG